MSGPAGSFTQLARGATRRCARCGSGGLFVSWFDMRPECPRCGLHFEREQGYWIGAMAVNISVVSAIFLVVLVVTMVLTVPDIPVAPLLAVTVPLMVLGPVLLFPFSRTLWVAIDRVARQHLS